MSSNMRFLTRNLCLAVATLLGIAATAAQAADAPATAVLPAPAAAASEQHAEELQELGEIVVRGKRLARAITDAEDDFFHLYNQLNKRYAYEIHCGYASLRPGSMIMQRVCVPNFIADNLEARSYPVPDYSGAGGACYGGGGNYMDGSRYSSPDYCGSSPISLRFAAVPRAVMVEALLLQHGKEYTDNMLNVINGDPRLRNKYDHLVGLYHEIDSVQHRYNKLTEVNRKPVKSNLGPRVL